MLLFRIVFLIISFLASSYYNYNFNFLYIVSAFADEEMIEPQATSQPPKQPYYYWVQLMEEGAWLRYVDNNHSPWPVISSEDSKLIYNNTSININSIIDDNNNVNAINNINELNDKPANNIANNIANKDHNIGSNNHNNHSHNYNLISNDKFIKKCPEISMGGEKYQMELHSAENEAFPLTCKLFLEDKEINKPIFLIDKNNKNKDQLKEAPIININLQKNKDIKKILVIGDTGCVITSYFSQDCKNNWFFKSIAETAATYKPDLIIHLGDYIYRSFGYPDNFTTWKKDFFTPVGELLTAAPWVMVRGNHEECARNARGWFTFLASSSISKSEENNVVGPVYCSDYMPFYSIDIKKDLKLIITDSTREENLITDLKSINEQFKESLENLWILTHRPLIRTGQDANSIIGYQKLFSSLIFNIKMILSGHIHSLQFVREDYRLQTIVGNSGAILDKINSYNNKNSKLEFGFLIIDFHSNYTLLTGYNIHNQKIMETIL